MLHPLVLPLYCCRFVDSSVTDFQVPMACTKCVGFSQSFEVNTPDEYRKIARQLIQTVNEGTFLLLSGSCLLEEILGETFPGDVLVHDFQCFACGRKFHLHADTYHGRVRWKPGDEPDLASRKPN